MDLLALVERRLDEVALGSGQFLLVSGEAGIGKTRLIAAVTDAAVARGFATATAVAFPGDTETSGGLLMELASDLRTSGDSRWQPIGERMSDRLRHFGSAEGDRHRLRRLLVADLTDLVAQLGRDSIPVVLVFEDLHWADQLSLEVLGHVARRLTRLTMLMTGAYRSEEPNPHAVTREWRTRLVNQRLAEELRLSRLTLADTAELTSSVLGVVAPASLVSAVHDRSDGIPLHVEELLAAISPDLDGISDASVPDTLADAILARAGALDPTSHQLAQAAAVIGRSFEFDLLVDVAQLDTAAVDRGLRRLGEVFMVQPGADPGSFGFRHSLIRDVLHNDTPLVRRRSLHARVATAADERGYPAAFLSAHFDQAGMAEPAYRYALIAAERAAAMSAHAEALTLYRRAAANRPTAVAPSERAALLMAIGDQAAATDDNVAALAAYQEAQLILSDSGAVVDAAAVVSRLVAVSHLLGEDLATRTARVHSALSTIDDLPGAEQVRATLLSALAAAYMLDRRLDEAIDAGERALVVGARDDAAALDTSVTLGSVLVFAGRMDEGWALLESAIARAEERHLEAQAARGYRMIGSCASVLVEYGRAEHWLGLGIAYAERVELWNHRHYMAAHLAHVLWATGDWESADQTARHTLIDGRGGITTRITALHVLGYLAMGRGAWSQASQLLEEALVEGRRMDELQRFSPALWGLAETALLRGDAVEAIDLCDQGRAASARVGDAAYLYPFLLTGLRARIATGDVGGAEAWLSGVAHELGARDIPGTLVAVEHGRGLLHLAAGDLSSARSALESAASRWHQRGRFWEANWARLDQAACAFKGRRHSAGTALAVEVRELGVGVNAQVLIDEADRILAGAGAGSRDNAWYPLTEREFEVATLVAAGGTNREIAAKLFLSPKTIGAHLEHILTKLGFSRRTEIAAWVVGVAGRPG